MSELLAEASPDGLLRNAGVFNASPDPLSLYQEPTSMRALKYLVLAGLLGVAAPALAAPVTYQLDPNHTMVLFSWNHFGYSNPTADIGLGEGQVVFDEQHPAQSRVEVSLPLARLDTHVAALTSHTACRRE